MMHDSRSICVSNNKIQKRVSNNKIQERECCSGVRCFCKSGVRVSLGLRSQVRISSRLLNHSNAMPMPSVPSLKASYCQMLVHPSTLNIPEATYIVYGPKGVAGPEFLISSHILCFWGFSHHPPPIYGMFKSHVCFSRN